jgi:signal transduction histidine kinase
MGRAIPLPARSFPARLRLPAVALLATLAVGVPVEAAAYPGDPAAAAGDLVVAIVFIVCGAAVWGNVRTGDLTGPLLVATGVAWMAGSISEDVALLHRGPLVQLLVTAPGGRPRTPAEWLVVTAGYVDAVVPGVGRAESATVALAVAVAGLALYRWARAGGVQRRARAVPAAASLAIAAVLVAGVLADPTDADAVLWFWEGALAATAVALFADLRWGGWESAVTSLVIDLGDVRAGSLSAALAHAVGDRSLVVGYRVGDHGYVDERGQTVVLPDAGADRAVTTVETDGVPAAVLVHDPAAFRPAGLSDAVTAALRLALDNMRLEAEIRARLRDVEASRARLLWARDTERRRLETRLRAGVDRRLDAAAHALAKLGANGDELISALPGELERARAELRRFAGGLHPRDLEAGGLAVALPELAAGAPLPVAVSVACGRLDEALEATAWFVCSEGLANVVKHAAATRAAITVECTPGCLLVRVEDDGRGGADASRGRGLRGLAARVEAAGGRLQLGDRPSRGTRLAARLPMKDEQ